MMIEKSKNLSRLEELSRKKLRKIYRNSVHLTEGKVTGTIMLKDELHQENKDRFLNKVKYNNIKERIETLKAIEELLKLNDWWEVDLGKAKGWMDEIGNIDKNLKHDYKGKELVISLILNAANQFCFWVDPNNQKFRTLSSGSYFKVNLTNLHSISDMGMTLRKERTDINNELLSLYNFALRKEFSWMDYLEAATDSKVFNTDYFRKKKNLLWMLLVRFKEYNNIDLNLDQEFIDTINPAIDYQLPKMLLKLGIIKCKDDDLKLDGPLVKDSIEEISLRAICYKTLCDIQTKYGFDQVFMDYVLWENRNTWCADVNHHCTLTTDY